MSTPNYHYIVLVVTVATLLMLADRMYKRTLRHDISEHHYKDFFARARPQLASRQDGLFRLLLIVIAVRADHLQRLGGYRTNCLL